LEVDNRFYLTLRDRSW